MNKTKTSQHRLAVSLLATVGEDLERGDRIDALDGLRMVERALRASLPDGMVQYLPKVKNVTIDPESPFVLRVTFAENLDPIHVAVARFQLKRAVRS